MPAYRNMASYVDYSLHDFPDQFALHNWKGTLSREKNHLFSSMAAWAVGLRYRDYDFRLNFNMANVLGQLGFLKESLKYYEKAGEGLMEEEAKEEHKKILAHAREKIEERIRGVESGKSRIIRV
jgi:tetratricopeptide (TPR) repeat protein